MYQKHPTYVHLTIGQRLEELPHLIYRQVAPFVIEEKQNNRRTYYRVLSGDSENLRVIRAIAEFFECHVEDVLDPSYFFQDPRKSPKRRSQLAKSLGFSKVSGNA